ncbi:hemerythrin domain-containing protein [Microtetraspora sp. AC03309]|uniref:hemerythrin domain-containing protein n=1 Tax=Microtetraspora sp. AC03309 TaxID=2779376 RepID=UPI001E6300F1|nr:hemerythrin domain-containing protein [Microtetraspora sp. AC03309]MCC5575813.1 hemerythrin domain-containing protein [Microtetraspora sp. AC03309]
MKPQATAPADTRMMGIIHDALRRDLERTRHALTERPYPENGRREAIGDHLRWMMRYLHDHHSSEDRGLWPLLRRKQQVLADHGIAADMLDIENAFTGHELGTKSPYIRNLNFASGGGGGGGTSTPNVGPRSTMTFVNIGPPPLQRAPQPTPRTGTTDATPRWNIYPVDTVQPTTPTVSFELTQPLPYLWPISSGSPYRETYEVKINVDQLIR